MKHDYSNISTIGVDYYIVTWLDKQCEHHEKKVFFSNVGREVRNLNEQGYNAYLIAYGAKDVHGTIGILWTCLYRA